MFCFLNIDFLFNANLPPNARNDQFLANNKYMLLVQGLRGRRLFFISSRRLIGRTLPSSGNME